MRDPIKAADAHIDEVTRIQEAITSMVEKSLRRNFLLRSSGNRRLIGSLGGLRGLVKILAATQIPRGFSPVKIEAQAPTFMQLVPLGNMIRQTQRLKATLVIEIECWKEDTDGQ